MTVDAPTEQPTEYDMSLFSLIGFGSEGLFDSNRCVVALFIRDLCEIVQALEAVQRKFFESGLMLGSGAIAEGHENRIAGMIMALIKRDELFVA